MHVHAIVFFCISIVHFSLCYDEVDSNDNPILEYLEMEPNSVRDHELVKIDLSAKLHKRDLREGAPMSFRAFGHDVKLWLGLKNWTLASSETPVYKAQRRRNHTDGVQYTIIPDALKNITRLLEDPEHLASIILDTDRSGRTTVTGFLKSPHDNSRLVIRSLPARVVKSYLRKKRSIDYSNDEFTDSVHHVVLKLNDDDDLENRSVEELYHRQTEIVPNIRHTDEFNSTSRPTILYPQILLYVDSSYRDTASYRNPKNLLKYMLVFWNSIDLIFRHVTLPSFRFSISAIILARSPRATPFIYNYMDFKNNAYNNRYAVYALLDYFYPLREIFPAGSYDIVVALSNLKFGLPPKYNTLGITTPPRSIPETKYVSRVTMVRDSGAFSGLYPAAHELGHVFRLGHELPTSDCSSNKGFIMAARPNLTNRTLLFSSCSQKVLRQRWRDDQYAYMYDEPKYAGAMLPTLLPGKLLNQTEQCLAYNGKTPCSPENKEIDICVQLWCGFEGLPETCNSTYTAAAPGTSCENKNGQSGVCLASRCVNVGKH